MKRITTCILAAALMVTGVFFALPKKSAFASAEVSAPIDVAAEISRAKQEWLDKEAALPHEAIPENAETHVKDGVTYTVIRDCAGFQAIENNLSGNYIVANDLDMTDFTTPIGWGPCKKVEGFYYSEPDPFSGIFDGNNYKINNLINLHKAPFFEGNSIDIREYQEFFYNIALFNNNEGTIRNIIIDESCEINCDLIVKQQGAKFIGDTVAFIAASNYGTIENCINYGNIFAANTLNSAAGICGVLGGSNLRKQKNVVLQNCVNYGYILMSLTEQFFVSTAGGIYVFDGVALPTRASVQGLYNFGKIKGFYAGGIGVYSEIEVNKDDNNTEDHTIYDSINYGDVNGAELSAKSAAGGIFALSSGRAINCENYGAIQGSYSVGGIAGRGFAQSSKNYGDVTGIQDVGGIVGVGWSYWDRNMTGNKQYGAVKGENYVGGIVGNSLNLAVKDNRNEGNVTGIERYVNGIAGGRRLIDSIPFNYEKSVGTQSNNINTGKIESPGRDAYLRDQRNKKIWLIVGSVVIGVGLIAGAIGMMIYRKRRRDKL